MKAFFGIILAMGLIDLPVMSDYWSRGGITQVPWFPSVTGRSRFFQILSNLHLVGNQQDDPDNKLFKLGNLTSLLNTFFRQRYTPSRNLSVDEQMIGTGCRVNFIQYMPKKPTKFGHKNLGVA